MQVSRQEPSKSSSPADFLQVQTSTGWGQTLQTFADWCQPQPGWFTLDVGCGPGLLPGLFAQRKCHAFGVDKSVDMLLPEPLHSAVALAEARQIPFPSRSFHLVTASNLLFLLPEVLPVLREMARLLRPNGQVCMLNPSEQMSFAAATKLADWKGLQGVACESLLNWARLAEANRRWTEMETLELFAEAQLRLVETTLKIGPGMARFARGVPEDE